MSALMMDELSWKEYEEHVRRGAPVFIVVGAVEQHGPHLPLGTDVFQGMAIARAAAEQVGGIVAPPITYGYKSLPKSGGGQSFIGTTSLDAQTLISLVRDLIREFARHEVRRLVFVDGHYENAMFLAEGIDLALRETDSGIRILVFRWPDLMSQATIDAIFGADYPGLALEHAAVIETSLMAVVRSDLVHWDRLVDDRASRFPAHDIYPVPADMVPRSGVLSPARRASVEHGQRIVGDVVRVIVDALRADTAT